MSDILGPDGKALAPIFGAIGNQFNRYMDWRDAYNKRVNAAPASNASGKRNSSVPSMMTKGEVYGDPTPTIQPGNRPRGPMFMDPVGPSRVMPGAGSFMDPVAPRDADVTQLATSPGRQILPAEETPGSGGGNITGPIPETSRVNKNGVEQKGIDMSRSFAELANEISPGNGRNYSSSQLPTTEGNKLSKWSEMIGQASAGPVPPTPEQSGNYTVIQPTDPIFAEAFGEYSAEGIGKAANSSNRLSNALKQVQSEVEMTPERRQAMASMAFYQADGGLEGIKARDLQNKVVYAGGQHYGLGEDPRNKGLGDKFKINRADARNIASGNITSDGLLEQYKDALKSTKVETASAAQDPLSAAGQAVKSQFADAAKTDFAMNNNPSTQVGVGPVVDPKIAETVDLTGDKGERYLKWLDSGAYLTKPFQ